MRSLRYVLSASFLGTVCVASTACNGVLGIDDHRLAPSGDGSAPLADGAAAADALGDAVGDARDAGGGLQPDGSPVAGGDGGQDGSPGGPVPSVLCGDSGICVVGGIYSVGRTPDDAGSGRLPGGGIVTLFDDGFEFGDTLCDPTGMTCVTGAIVP
jgi:hypothetical protein